MRHLFTAYSRPSSSLLLPSCDGREQTVPAKRVGSPLTCRSACSFACSIRGHCSCTNCGYLAALGRARLSSGRWRREACGAGLHVLWHPALGQQNAHVDLQPMKAEISCPYNISGAVYEAGTDAVCVQEPPLQQA